MGHKCEIWRTLAERINLSRDSATNETFDDLHRIWQQGYSVAELWGFSKPVARGEPTSDNTHILLWGILGIVEYQVDHGAGHKYLRDRLWNRDWIAIGCLEPRTRDSTLRILPPIENAKFGHKLSAVGDGITNYIDVRIVARDNLHNA